MAQASGQSYVYLAVRPTGGRRLGVRQARSAKALADSLRRESLLLVRWWSLPAWASKSDKLSLKDQSVLNDQLSQLLSRGVPLVEALEVACATVRPAARGRLEKIREQVAGGSSFADACKSAGGFDDVTIAVYRGAERTGDLAGAAKRLAETTRRRLAVQGKAATLMVYPIIVMTISVLVAVAMLVGVVPMLGKNLRDAGISLPAFSAAIVDAGTWMRAHLSVVGLAVAGAVGLLLVFKNAVGRLFGRMMRTIPLMRDVTLNSEAARFFAVMAAMTRSGIPLADALAVANQAVTHPTVRSQLDRLRSRLVGGGLLRTLIDEVTSLPVSVRRLLIAAEKSGDLEQAFDTLSGDLADEVERSSQRLLAALQPLLIVFMFAVIGSLLMAILLPMLTLSSRIGR